MKLIEVSNVVGEPLLLPDWHPRAILQEHNDLLAKRRRWKGVRAYNELDLQRWGLPSDPREAWDEDVIKVIKSVPVHRGAKSYVVYNSALATTAAPIKQPTGTAIRTMMQLAPAIGFNGRLIAWGCSFDGSAAATPGQVEVFGTTVAATMSTAYAAADIQPYGDPNAVANTVGATGVPFNLSTATSGFATAAVTEGIVANYRMADLEMLPPTAPYIYQWPLGREFEFASPSGTQTFIRVRMTFGATVNAYIWTLVEF